MCISSSFLLPLTSVSPRNQALYSLYPFGLRRVLDIERQDVPNRFKTVAAGAFKIKLSHRQRASGISLARVLAITFAGCAPENVAG